MTIFCSESVAMEGIGCNASETTVKSSTGAGAGSVGVVDARERHKLAERERRKSMRTLFLSLHAALPHAHTLRKEHSVILDEIIKYIPLATARLRSLQNQRDAAARPKAAASSIVSECGSVSTVAASYKNSGDWDIRVAPEPTSSVAIRVRGVRVNVSLTDTTGPSHAPLLSAVLDELEASNLDFVRFGFLRSFSLFSFYGKCYLHDRRKINDGLQRSPAQLKARLQDLASKLPQLRSSSSLKRSFDQVGRR